MNLIPSTQIAAETINDDANAFTTLTSAIAAVQADVDQNEADGDAGDNFAGRLINDLQADVDQNETDSDAAEGKLTDCSCCSS